MERTNVEKQWLSSKPLVGVVGCPPLPGSGRYGGIERDMYIHHVTRDARALSDGGFDGLMLQNIDDLPTPKVAAQETIAWMAALATILRSEVSIPIGISLLEDDPEAILAVAHAAGANFVRIKVYVGAMAGPDGLVEGCAARVQRYRRALMADHIMVMADVFDRTRWPLGNATLEEMCHEAVWFGKADGLVITGRSFDQSVEFAGRARSRVAAPIWIGGGVDAGNVGKIFDYVDGAIVATSTKVDGDLLNPVDLDRVKALVAAKSGMG